MISAKLSKQIGFSLIVCLSVIQAVLFFISYQSQKQELEKLSTHFEKELEKGQNGINPLDEENIKDRLQSYTLNSLGFLFITAIFVTIGTLLALNKFALKHIIRLRDTNSQIAQTKEASYIPIDEAPENEIGEVILVRNKMLLSLEKANIELKEKTKLTALGLMASRMGHEINNPLQAIMLRLDNLKYFLREGKKTQEQTIDEIEKVEKAAEQIKNITKALKTYSRRGKEGGDELVPTSLKEILNDVTILGKAVIEREDGVFLKIPEVHEGLVVDCRPGQISQVIVNLISNAFHAIKDLPAKWVRLEVDEDEEFIIVRVVDSGAGISKEVQDKVFEPFFTTKSNGEGTGLGLSICNSIVSEHHGIFGIDEKDSNTCFYFKLPRSVGNKLEMSHLDAA